MTPAGSSRTTNGGEGTRSLTADAIARLVRGELRGDAGVRVERVAPLDRAGAGELTFLSSARYAPLFERSGAAAALVAPELANAPSAVPTRIVVAKPHEAMLHVLAALYEPPTRVAGIHPSVVIGRGARMGRGVAIGPKVVVGENASLGDRVSLGAGSVVGAGVEIGEDTTIYPGVTLYPGATVGRRVILHAGVRIASDGFGYVFRDGSHQKIPHVGRCVIEDDVEIGANSTIDRGSIDDTVIGAGTKIDNLVHVGHNVRVGRLCLLMAHVGVAGSTRIEDGAILAGQAGVTGHVTIGAGARIAAQAGVIGDVPAGESWSGYPARPHREAMRASAALLRLGAIMRRLERLLERSAE